MTRSQLAADPAGATGKIAPPEVGAKRDPALPEVASRQILGMRVDATTYAETAEAVAILADSGGGGVVCVAAVNNAVHALDDPEFRRAMNAADRVTPDGVPLVYALRRLGLPAARRVYGPSLTTVLCAMAEERGLPVGFLGGRPEVLAVLVEKLCARFPALRVAFAASPPFRELTVSEDAELRDAIEASGVRVLFVGLGCPKQERWMAEHRERLSCVQVGVGAAFDFLAGFQPTAPAWMQRAGLEWLYRLAREPRRLWRRYLVGNPRFVYHFVRERVRAALFAGEPS